MQVGELLARLKLDTAEFDNNLKGAEGKASGFGSKLGPLLTAGALGAIAALGAALIGIGGAALSGASEASAGVRTLQAELGVTQGVAEQLQTAANQVFANGFTGSITEATSAIAEARRQLGEMSSQELSSVATGALAITDTFGADYPAVLNAAKTLTEEFGLSNQQALDLITSGFQKGLNSSGDFLDSITEYGPQFGTLDATASQFFSSLETGLQEGVLGTDKVGDLFKEFAIRIADGSTTTSGALSQLGIDSDALFAQMASGSVTGVDAFELIKGKLAEVEDPILRNQLGVALMGTQWEDLGASAVLSIDTARTSIEGMTGATDGLNVKYGSLGEIFETVKRRAIVALIPLGEKLLELANGAMPYVLAAFSWFETNLPGMLSTASGVVSSVVGTISGLFNGPLAGSVTKTGGTFQTIWAQVSGIVGTSAAIVTTVLGALAGFISANQGTIQTYFTTAWNGVSALISGVLGFIQGLLRAVLAAIQGDWRGAWTNIKQAVESLVGGMWTFIKAAFDNGKLVLSLVGGAIKDKLVELWGEAKKGVVSKAGEIWSGVKGKFDELKSNVSGLASGFVSSAREVGTAIVDGIANGIRNGASAIVDAARDAAKAALDAAKKLLGIKSPSREAAAQIGLPFAQGIAAGISANHSLVSSAIAGALNAALGSVAPTQAGAQSAGATTVQHYHLNASYSNYQSEGSLRDDVRTLQLLGAGL